jgi:hypothetical protein
VASSQTAQQQQPKALRRSVTTIQRRHFKGLVLLPAASPQRLYPLPTPLSPLSHKCIHQPIPPHIFSHSLCILHMKGHVCLIEYSDTLSHTHTHLFNNIYPSEHAFKSACLLLKDTQKTHTSAQIFPQTHTYKTSTHTQQLMKPSLVPDSPYLPLPERPRAAL